MINQNARAIFLIVLAMLIAGGLIAYVATRSILIADLDNSLAARAMALPQVKAPQGQEPAWHSESDDRYLVVNDIGQTIARQHTGLSSPARPRILSSRFFDLGDGTRERSVTIRALASPRPGAAPIPVTITYSGPCNRLDTVLHHLSIMLAIIIIAGSITAALLSRLAARLTLRPLGATAEILRTIEERHLDRRIDVARLPSELVPVATRLNEMLARLERSYLQRKQFLADMSHELRTPLAAMAASLQVTLRRPREAEVYRSSLQTCEAEVRHLKRLVELVMEQVRNELRDPLQTIQHIEVTSILAECATAAKVLASERSITVAFEFQEQKWLHLEPTRLRSAVMNILFNAVEHNRIGGRVEMTATSTPEGIAVRIRDNGPGIAPEQIPHLFEPFFRGDHSRQNGQGTHLGLGLYIVRSHVQAMRGRCTVESEVGIGSEFRLEFPDVTQLSKTPEIEPLSQSVPDPAVSSWN